MNRLVNKTISYMCFLAFMSILLSLIFNASGIVYAYELPHEDDSVEAELNYENLDYVDILGSAASYGITANELINSAPLNTNIAAGKLVCNGVISKGVTNYPANTIIGEYAGHDGIGMYEWLDNRDKCYEIKTTESIRTEILKYYGHNSGLKYVYFDSADSKEQIEQTVSDMVNGTLSDRIIAYCDYSEGTHIITVDDKTINEEIDITSKEPGTYYVKMPLDVWNKLQDGRPIVKLNVDQTVVFNVPDMAVDINACTVEVYNRTSSKEGLSADECVKHVIYNLPYAETVNLIGTSGVVIAQKATVDIQDVYMGDGYHDESIPIKGWIVADRVTTAASNNVLYEYVSNNIPEYNVPTDIYINVKKVLIDNITTQVPVRDKTVKLSLVGKDRWNETVYVKRDVSVDAEGEVRFARLLPGRYVLTDNTGNLSRYDKPENISGAMPYEFTVNSDGLIASNNIDRSSTPLAQYSGSIYLYEKADSELYIEVHKNNNAGDTGVCVPGAAYGIKYGGRELKFSRLDTARDYMGKSITSCYVYDIRGSVSTLNADDNGYIYIEDLPEDISYIVQPKSTSADCVIGEEKELTLYSAESEHFLRLYSEMKNAAVEMICCDKRDNSIHLPGGTYSLYDADDNIVRLCGDNGVYDYAEGNNTSILKTSGDGYLTIGHLPYGKYYFREINSPSGYDKCEDRIELSVNGTQDIISILCTSDKALKAAKLAFRATVTLDGGKFKSGFTCYLKDNSGTTLSQRTVNATEYVNTASYVFAPIEYTSSDVGKTFSYTIEQRKGTSELVEYATNKYNARVSVLDNGNGEVGLSVVINDKTVSLDSVDGVNRAESVVFKNLYLKKTTPTPTPSPTKTPTPSPTKTPTPSPTKTPTPSPTKTPTPSPTKTPTPSPTKTPTPSPTKTPTPSPTKTPTPSPTKTPTPGPTKVPTSTPVPNKTKTPPASQYDPNDGNSDENGTYGKNVKISRNDGRSLGVNNGNVNNLYPDNDEYIDESIDLDEVDDYLTYGLLEKPYDYDNNYYEEDSDYYDDAYDDAYDDYYDDDEYYDDEYDEEEWEEEYEASERVEKILIAMIPETPLDVIGRSIIPIVVIMVLLFCGSFEWRGALCPESVEGIRIVRGRKNYPGMSIQDYIDEAYSKGEDVRTVRKSIRHSGCRSYLRPGMKMKFEVSTPANTTCSRTYRANEHKMYKTLSSFEGKDCNVTVYIFRDESNPDAVLDYRFGITKWSDNTIFDVDKVCVDYDSI